MLEKITSYFPTNNAQSKWTSLPIEMLMSLASSTPNTTLKQKEMKRKPYPLDILQ